MMLYEHAPEGVDGIAISYWLAVEVFISTHFGTSCWLFAYMRNVDLV